MSARPRIGRTAAAALVAGTTMMGTTLLTAAAQAAPALPAGVTVTVTAGVLTVTGDQTANTLVVGQNPAHLVTLNGAPVLNGTVPRTALTRVHMDGGAGNDSLRFDETNGAMPPAEFLGGEGTDQLLGGSSADTLDGGPGIDDISGLAGDDHLIGGPGHDTVVGGTGADTVSMGADPDLFTWNPGDGKDQVDGDADRDTMIFNSDPVQNIDLVPDASRLHVLMAAAPLDEWSVRGVELLEVKVPDFVKPPNDPFLFRAVLVEDAPGTGVGIIRVTFAPHTGPKLDVIDYRGTAGADRIRLAGLPASGVEVFGLAQTVVSNHADRLDVSGDDGDDVIDATRLPGGTTRLREFGGGGHSRNRFNDGDDTLIGTPGDDQLDGGGGHNHIDGRGGNDDIRDG
jgi:Ca2+-binding RTX toxin-like protein